MPSSASSIQTVTEVAPRVAFDEKCDECMDRTEADQFPEGGGAAWCTVLGAALVQLCAFGYTMSFGVFQEFYTLHYLTNESTSAISWIGSVNAFVLSCSSLFAGALYDRGYFYHLMIGGSLMQSFTLFMLSLAKPGQYYQIFLAQGIGLGIAQGLMYVPTMAIASHYFRRRRTLAMSLVSSGSSLGQLIHPVMLNYLFNRSVGFANGVRISAAFVSIILLIACLLMRTRLEPPEHHVSYVSVGRGIVRDVPFCLMSMGVFFFQIGFSYPLFYLQLDSVMHKNSETFSFYSLVLLSGGSLLGRLSAGFIAPYVSVPWLAIIATAVCGIFTLGMIGLNGVASVVVLGTGFGCFSGIYIAMLSPLIALLTSDFSELGARMGIGITVLGVGALLGGPISGALLTSQYKWWQPSLFGGLVALIGCGFLVMMQLALIRRRRHASEGLES